MRWALGFLFLAVVLGGWLRISGLEERSISHPEMYVPGIRLPDGASEPAERVTALKVLTGTFSVDVHPPGYYLAMLQWTRAFGTSLFAIRLPSALFGLATIGLTGLLGFLLRRPMAGALAALLVAVSGYQVFWTQSARMFAQECFLGLLATVLLVSMVRAGHASTYRVAAYVLAVVAGMSTDLHFWTVLGAHMIWTSARDWTRRSFSEAARMQVLSLILGFPFLAFTVYQSQNVVPELSRDVPRFLAEFASFAFLLPSEYSGSFPGLPQG